MYRKHSHICLHGRYFCHFFFLTKQLSYGCLQQCGDFLHLACAVLVLPLREALSHSLGGDWHEDQSCVVHCMYQSVSTELGAESSPGPPWCRDPALVTLSIPHLWLQGGYLLADGAWKKQWLLQVSQIWRQLYAPGSCSVLDVSISTWRFGTNEAIKSVLTMVKTHTQFASLTIFKCVLQVYEKEVCQYVSSLKSGTLALKQLCFPSWCPVHRPVFCSHVFGYIR